MHTIKSAARRQAWYPSHDDGTPATYNPFGRPNRNRVRSMRDEEQGTTPLGHVQTEGDARSPIEEGRQNQWRTTNSSNGVKKSGTFPSGPSGDIPRYQSGGEIIDEKDAKTPSDEAPTTQTTGFTDSSNTTTRKRKFHIPFLGHKGSDTTSDSTLVSPQTEQPDGDRPKNKMGVQSPKTPIIQQLRIVFASWINILLVFVPVGLAFQYAKLNGTATFIFNFLAIIPLASMLSFATEECALYVGETLGGLLNASFGNATELIVSIIALTQRKITIVQTSLIGSILSNLLLVLGCCFLLGGYNRLEQHFNVTVAQTAASLLALALGGLITPTAYKIIAENDDGVTPTSRGAAVLLLWTYVCYLVFQLRTHTTMYNAKSKKVDKQNLFKGPPAEPTSGPTGIPNAAQAAAAGGESVSDGNLTNQQKSGDDETEEEHEQPQLGLVVSLCVLAAATALIAVTSDGMVSAIDAVTQPAGPLSEEFVGLILVPIVGNAAEHATAVTCAIKDKTDLAIGVAIGSSLQIALLVIPLLICFNWFGVGAPADLTLAFDGFQIVVIFIAIILVNYVVQDGRSNWLEGMQLFIVYFIFAIAAWYYPADNPQG